MIKNVRLCKKNRPVANKNPQRKTVENECGIKKAEEKIGGNLMSVEQYQKSVNSLDKEIADLEKKKAESDKKSAEAQKKASGVSISKSASVSTVKSKMAQIYRYNSDAIKAANVSADLQKKIADKRIKRNEAYLKLQKETQSEQKKQDRATKKIQDSYESRIRELQAKSMPIIKTVDAAENEELPEYDVFVSHAWEDKESFADEFVKELRKLGAKVWYDTTQMKWGDSMRAKIDDGLKKSRFGVVVLSPNYIADHKYWTKAELDGLFQMQSINGKTLLPIWHNLTKQQVMNYSPIIAGKLAMSTALMTAQEIANELIKLLPEETEEQTNGQNEFI